jgi:uncharacterized protein (TIGR02246 family)
MPDTRVSERPGFALKTDDVRTIRLMAAEWQRAENERDLSGILRMVTHDVVILRPQSDALHGRQALEDLYRRLWLEFDYRHTIRMQEVRVAGDMAFTWTIEEIVLTPRNGGHAFHLKGNGMSVLRRGVDGNWRFARAMTNALPSAL